MRFSRDLDLACTMHHLSVNDLTTTSNKYYVLYTNHPVSHISVFYIELHLRQAGTRLGVGHTPVYNLETSGLFYIEPGKEE